MCMYEFATALIQTDKIDGIWLSSHHTSYNQLDIKPVRLPFVYLFFLIGSLPVGSLMTGPKAA